MYQRLIDQEECVDYWLGFLIYCRTVRLVLELINKFETSLFLFRHLPKVKLQISHCHH